MHDKWRMQRWNKRKRVYFTVQTPVPAEIWKRLLSRNTQDEDVEKRVAEILKQVQTRGIDAVKEYTKTFDKVELDALKVANEEIEAAVRSLNANETDALVTSIKAVRSFCLKEKAAIQDTMLEGENSRTVLRFLPVENVGIYAPAGKAPLPSSVIMAAIPAQVAGVKNLILASPPQADGKVNKYILAVAGLCGIKEIYVMGGAQAIGALAYVFGADVIAGPGNVYVSIAKQIVQSQGKCRIDVLAGPSEIAVIIEPTGNPKQDAQNCRLIASDMLAQAEHGPTSAAVCLTTDETLAKKLAVEVSSQLTELNDPIATKAIENYGAIIVTKDLEEAVALSNEFAPEHVEVYVNDPQRTAEKLTNAGAVFVGTAEVFGDYGFDGSNHILPTGRAARFSGGMTVRTFMKPQYVKYANTQAQAAWSKKCATFASMEKLCAHEISARLREGWA